MRKENGRKMREKTVGKWGKTRDKMAGTRGIKWQGSEGEMAEKQGRKMGEN